MTIVLISLAAATLGGAIGFGIRRHIATLSYRDIDEVDLPEPGPRNWLIWTSAIAWAGLGALLDTTDSWALAPVLLPLAVAGPSLAAIDLDVMRVPNRILGPVAFVTLVGLASTILAQGDTATAVRGVIGGAVTGAVFWLMNALSRDGIGFGDVKLAALVGVVAASVSLYTVWLGLLVGSLAALLWTKSRRRSGPLPYAPWLLFGGWVALIATAWG